VFRRIERCRLAIVVDAEYDDAAVGVRERRDLSLQCAIPLLFFRVSIVWGMNSLLEPCLDAVRIAFNGLYPDSELG
jgi:hypothetical protein